MTKIGIAECDAVSFPTCDGMAMLQTRDLLAAGAPQSMNVIFGLPNAGTLNIVPLLH